MSEMESTPNLRYISEIREELDQELGKIGEALEEVPNHYFTIQEAAEYSEKLDSLEKMFSEMLQSQEDESKNLQDELSEMRSEITLLKNQISILTKRNWFMSFLSKTYQWGKRHPNEVQALAAAAVGLLPDGVKEHVPQELFINEEVQQ